MKDIDREAPPLTEEPEGGGEVVGACVAVLNGIYELRYDYYATTHFKDQQFSASNVRYRPRADIHSTNKARC